MILFRLAALVGAASLCLGCWPIPKVDQEDYCFSKYAFTAEITSRKISTDEIEYEYNVEKMYKGDTVSMTLIGHGESNSCGPQTLELNTKYLIYAQTDVDSNSLQIVAYKNMAYVASLDIQRMENSYDCSCEIKHDYEGKGLPEPSKSECNAPVDFCPNSGFCKKSTEGKCTWGNLGTCN